MKENVFPDRLRRLPYRIRKRVGGSGWLSKEGPNEKSIDRTYPTVAALLGGGGDAQTDYDDSRLRMGLGKSARLEESIGEATLSLRSWPEGSIMNDAFIHGFLDEMEKRGGSTVERIADMLKDVKQHVQEGHKARGIVGAAGGLETGLKKNPWLWLGPAAGYAGYRLLKGVLNWGKEDQR